MKIFLFLVVLLIILLLFIFLRLRKPKLLTGGIYSVNSGEGDIGIVKVLVLEGDAIHIRIYANKYEQRPKIIDPTQLTLGVMQGIGHLPIRAAEFISWKPKFIMQTEVEAEELECYEMWKDGGMVWSKELLDKSKR